MMVKNLHRPGIEPGPPAWQASILPLNQRCRYELMSCKCILLSVMTSYKGQKVFAVGRIRTYAPRGNLISSQTP